ncbi:hypothetical protein RF11_03852 [Thelohanellus kitauei]|uniref:Uncharacterized protein n=1 Tax=Thelohanellus kitauei TaxID=669202 RepID=A0A0C2MRX6_THEKT|nr:hypothetical protein RF11_03852 [Thelohanellus kitauei]
MLRRKPNTLIDIIRPNILANLEAYSTKQSIDDDKGSRYREFEAGDNVWIKNELQRGYHPGKVIERSGDLSYTVETDGLLKRKHADQLRTGQAPGEYLSCKPNLPEFEEHFYSKTKKPTLEPHDNSSEPHIETVPHSEMPRPDCSTGDDSRNESVPLRRSERIKNRLAKESQGLALNQENKNGRM